MKNPYHNDQCCRSYKTPDEISIKSKPTSVMEMQKRGQHSKAKHESYIRGK